MLFLLYMIFLYVAKKYQIETDFKKTPIVYTYIRKKQLDELLEHRRSGAHEFDR